MTALPDQCLDFDSELEPALPAIFSVFAWAHRTSVDLDYVNELQAWADGFDVQPRLSARLPVADALLDVVLQVDVAAGEHFRGCWRRRLADAQGDCGYVARQMRKAGVPLDLALAVLLIPQPLLEAAQKSSRTPTSRADPQQGIAALGDQQRGGSPWLDHSVQEGWRDTGMDGPCAASPQPRSAVITGALACPLAQASPAITCPPSGPRPRVRAGLPGG